MRPIFFDSPASFRDWLVQHHASKTEVLVGYFRKGTGHPTMSWSESVDQALCFGWIDGVRRTVDDARYCIRFTPRKPTSIWSAINVAKVEALEKAGLMTAAGRAAYALRKPERTAIYAFERKSAAAFSEAQLEQFKANPKAHTYFEAQPPGYRRTLTHWVVSAKRPETQAKRLAQLISASAANRRVE